MKRISENCESQVNRVNFCGSFKTTLYIYGKDQENAANEVLQMIKQLLDSKEPSKIHPEIVKISFVEELLKINEGETTLPSSFNKKKVSKLGIAGVVLSVVLFTSCLWWCCIRQQEDQMSKSDDICKYSSNSRRGNRGVFQRMFRQTRYPRAESTYNIKDESIKPSFDSEEHRSFRVGSKSLLTNGKPVEIEFDESYSQIYEHSLDPRAHGIV